MAAGLPVAVLGWTLAPEVIGRFFPQYAGSVQAVRFSLVSGLLMSLSPATQVLGSLKAWPSLAVTIGVTLLTRWAFPWVLSDLYPPLEGVARGNVWASAITSAHLLALVCRATGGPTPDASPAEAPREAPPSRSRRHGRSPGQGVHRLLEPRGAPAPARARRHGRKGAAGAGPPAAALPPHRRIRIGDHCRIQSGFAGNPVGGNGRMSLWVGPGASLTLGHRVGLSNSTIVCLQSVTLEDDVFIGGDSKIYDTDFHSLDPRERLSPGNPGSRTAPVVIRRRAFVGGHSILLKGTSVGEATVVGAGSVVRSAVPALQVWAGNPARFLAPLPASAALSLVAVASGERRR